MLMTVCFLKRSIKMLLVFGCILYALGAQAQKQYAAFRVIGFYTAKNDLAHISFVGEANRWMHQMALAHHFHYDSTDNWNNMNDEFLAKYQVVVFLDTRPEEPEQRAAFQRYMEGGGGWLGFHFSAFALTPSAYPQNWNWYHNQFVGAGEYKGNIWRPVPALLRAENRRHSVMRKLPKTFRSSPNEWYSWQNDLRKNKDIQVLWSIDPASFPLGTGPKPHEIWYAGDYPVVWTNKKFRMIYMNMGHNDMDYDGGTDRQLSYTFGNRMQDRLILNALLWLGQQHKNSVDPVTRGITEDD